jgi:hypothetical protein
VFKKEYEEYLDILLGDGRFLLSHRLQKVVNGPQQPETYRLTSILRDTLLGQANSNLITREEILRDKLLVELIERPKKLWKFLDVSVRNEWIHRVVVRGSVKKTLRQQELELSSMEETAFRTQTRSILARICLGMKYWPVLRSFLKSELNTAKTITALLRSYKSTERAAFKTYFFTKYFSPEPANQESWKASSLPLEKRTPDSGLAMQLQPSSQKKPRPKLTKKGLDDF